MQPLSWYINRLRSMSATEIVWRIHSVLRDRVDHLRVLWRLYPDPTRAGVTALAGFTPGFRIPSPPAGFWATEPASTDECGWRSRLLAAAEEISSSRLSFFNLQGVSLGSPINWHRDHNLGIDAPTCFAQSIDYRDIRVAGDCKLVWEPNRHHQFMVLARAWRATGEPKYARAFLSQMNDWLSANPFGCGMNWRSPLELGIRLINWVWAIDLTLDSGLFDGAIRERILHAIYLHLLEITRKYSKGSSANNHLVGEAAGVFVAASYCPFFTDAARWIQEAKAILEEEITAQSYDDGCTREQALGYQLFVIQFYLFCGLVGKWSKNDFSTAYWNRLETMIEFVGRLTEGGRLPFFGDRDDGYVLALGSTPDDPKGILASGAILTGRTEFRNWAGSWQEMPLWLFGSDAKKSFSAIPGPQKNKISSWSFPDAGHYLLQSGSVEGGARMSLLFDCAELGYGAIAAHGHADALSFTLRVGGDDVFIDPGTYDYFSYPAWRAYFKSTRGHNTVLVDGVDQSEMLGPFLWGKRARARCLEWQPNPAGGGRVTGEHDGYQQLPDPVLHRRTVEMSSDSRSILVEDILEMHGCHSISLSFHVSHGCTLRRMDNGNRFQIHTPRGAILQFELDEKLRVETIFGQKEPIAGWESLGYHHKVACTTIAASGHFSGPASFRCRATLSGVAE